MGFIHNRKKRQKKHWNSIKNSHWETCYVRNKQTVKTVNHIIFGLKLLLLFELDFWYFLSGLVTWSKAVCIISKPIQQKEKTWSCFCFRVNFHFKTLRRERAPLSLGVESERVTPSSCFAPVVLEVTLTHWWHSDPTPNPQTPKPDIDPEPDQFHDWFHKPDSSYRPEKTAHPDVSFSKHLWKICSFIISHAHFAFIRSALLPWYVFQLVVLIGLPSHLISLKEISDVFFFSKVSHN